MRDLGAVRSPHMRAKKPGNQAVLKMRGFLRAMTAFVVLSIIYSTYFIPSIGRTPEDELAGCVRLNNMSIAIYFYL
jgi:hypothetical protein